MNPALFNTSILLFKKLWCYLPKRRQKQLGLLLILMILSTIFDVVSVGLVIPFIGALTAPDQIYNHPLAQPLMQTLELTSSNQLILPLTILFIITALIAGAIRLILLYAMTRFSFATGADISVNIYRRTLYQEYSSHLSLNSSRIINGIISKTNTVIGGILIPILTLISSTLLVIGILAILFIINIRVALSVSICFGFLYWVVIFFTKTQLKNNSQNIANQSTQKVKSLQEGLGGIRDVLINGSQQYYCQLYSDADLPVRRALASNRFISGSPRYVMESIGMVLIAGLSYVMSLEGSLIAAVPVLATLAVSAQKLLPALQQFYSSYSDIRGSTSSLEDVLELLDQPLPEYADQPRPAPISFEKEIKLKNLSFRYTEDSSWVLKNISLSIAKGDSVGFVGITGIGKSTLLDIIMGLLNPTDGEFMIDQHPINKQNRRAWQAHIAHVPQSIYLSDSTIEENIAFGIPKEKINRQQVKKAAKQAQLSKLVEDLKDGYQTFVGEKGVRMSGGQCQRIGIARALYKKANVLVFDESTSALDGKTEMAVLDEISKLNKELTILIIAHRVDTLRNCNKIIRFCKNNQIRVGTYQELINS